MTKTLDQFINEAEDDKDYPDRRDQLINFITQNFYRFINNPSMQDDRALLMLIAALATISASDGETPQAMQAARRLAQNALARGGRMRKEK